MKWKQTVISNTTKLIWSGKYSATLYNFYYVCHKRLQRDIKFLLYVPYAVKHSKWGYTTGKFGMAKMDGIYINRHVHYIGISNMVVLLFICISGSYLVLSTLIDCQHDWKKFYCGKLCTSTLGNFVVLILGASIGVVLTAYSLLVPWTKCNAKYALTLLFFVKTIEIGGLIYCEFCLIIFPYLMPTVNEDWCIPFSSAILALIIAPVLVLDIYFLVLIVKFDEKLRNGSEDIKWPNATHTTTTIIEKEYFELGAMRNQSEISNSDNYTSYLE